MADAVTALTREIMTLQAEGNYAKAKDDDRRSSASSGRRCKTVLDRLTAVPVDIEPRFTSAR